MATNNIKIFDQNKANMLTDEAYNTSTQRLNGVQQGIASSQLQNKTLYQVSLVAYAIGQMMQANGLNANDADAVSTFAGNLSNTIVQKILDKADTTEAKDFTVNNKFITPQTWKAAYDFMKADSDMVTSAVDDTHYITPKLLKEGANLFGGRIELEDGTITSWRTFNKKVVSKNQPPFSAADSSYIRQILIDKLKRYYIIHYYSNVDYVYTNYIALIDYNTNEILDKLGSGFTFQSEQYNIKTDDNLILGLSENMFLLPCIPYQGTTSPINAAIDFSTGKFVIKNIRVSPLYGQGVVLTNFSKNTFFKNKLYAIEYGTTSSSGSIYKQYIIEYDIKANAFNSFEINSDLSCIFSFIDNNDNFCMVMWVYSNRTNVYLNFLSSVDNFANHSMGTSFSAYTGYWPMFQYKNSYLYILVQDSNAYGTLGKYDVNNIAFVKQLFYKNSSLGSHSNGLMIVNDEENSCYVGITGYVKDGFYGPGGAFELNENYFVPYSIGELAQSSEGVIILSQSAVCNIVRYKQNDERICLNTNFAIDIEYAYFGAPVTEIPEST